MHVPYKTIGIYHNRTGRQRSEWLALRAGERAVWAMVLALVMGLQRCCKLGPRGFERGGGGMERRRRWFSAPRRQGTIRVGYHISDGGSIEPGRQPLCIKNVVSDGSSGQTGGERGS